VESFDANSSLLMAVAEPACILKTTDGGRTWGVVFADSTKGMFLDAMHFRDDRHGIVVGDPIGGNFFVRRTDDGGNTWRVIYPALAAQPGEACFAASGSNVLLLADGNYQVVTGGKISRLTGSGAHQTLPLVQGAESTGAFSVAARGKKRVIVGGDFTKEKEPRGTCALSADGGTTWALPAEPPRGYRSCVIYLDGDALLSCGPSGVDRSRNGGRRWEPVSPEGFHVATRAKKGRVVYLAGAGGRVARLDH
ncbi:MAG: oxidoreductase, partial [Cytophagales bacterium]|nr:oxidoreductase [Cytophagales bacterium]